MTRTASSWRCAVCDRVLDEKPEIESQHLFPTHRNDDGRVVVCGHGVCGHVSRICASCAQTPRSSEEIESILDRDHLKSHSPTRRGTR